MIIRRTMQTIFILCGDTSQTILVLIYFGYTTIKQIITITTMITTMTTIATMITTTTMIMTIR